MGLEPIQEVKNVSAQRFKLKSTDAVQIGWFLQRDGSASSFDGGWLPDAALYASSAGTTSTIGIMPYTRSKVYLATDDLYQVGTTREKEREITPITQVDVYGQNLGTGTITYGANVSPAISGFQASTTSMQVVGKAMEDIPARGKGIVRVNTDVQFVSL